MPSGGPSRDADCPHHRCVRCQGLRMSLRKCREYGTAVASSPTYAHGTHAWRNGREGGLGVYLCTDEGLARAFPLLQAFSSRLLGSRLVPYNWASGRKGKLAPIRHSFSTSMQQRGYDTFRRTTRYWRHLTMTARSGQAHSIDVHLPRNRWARSLATICPACPEPGFNLQSNWEVLQATAEHGSAFPLVLP